MSHLWFAPYSRQFAQPLVYGSRKIDLRKGVCVRWETEGSNFFSEASPLKGHSQESTEDVIDFFSDSANLLAGFNETSVVSDKFFPSIQFCLRGLQLQKQVKPGGRVFSNALVAWTNPENALKQIQEKVSLGYQTLKLKVFPENAKDVLNLLAKSPEGVLFRLDGNRSLDIETLRMFSPMAFKIDYFEEPLANWSDLDNSSNLVCAADESANNPRSLAAVLRQKFPPQVLVIKPTVSGLTKLPPIRTIFTSALEAEPGRRSLLAFLMALNSKECHGISTGFLMRDNFMEDLAEFTSIPPVGNSERQWLNTLPWRKIL